MAADWSACLGEHVEAYLAPTTTTPELRRGTVVSGQLTRSYAQVAIPGRSFDQIDDEQDINRPFQVIGNFDDAELVSLVQLLRSNPPTRGMASIESSPILSIRRIEDDCCDSDKFSDRGLLYTPNLLTY